MVTGVVVDKAHQKSFHQIPRVGLFLSHIPHPSSPTQRVQRHTLDSEANHNIFGGSEPNRPKPSSGPYVMRSCATFLNDERFNYKNESYAGRI